MEIKRAYESPHVGDGIRVLVDRLWPRGLSKEAARIDFWMKDIAPSADLRKWFSHDPLKWDEFREKYFLELDAKKETVGELALLAAKERRITLLYGAADPVHNNAAALRQYLEIRACSR